jgi:hypothetical protein
LAWCLASEQPSLFHLRNQLEQLKSYLLGRTLARDRFISHNDLLLANGGRLRIPTIAPQNPTFSRITAMMKPKLQKAYRHGSRNSNALTLMLRGEIGQHKQWLHICILGQPQWSTIVR